MRHGTIRIAGLALLLAACASQPASSTVSSRPAPSSSPELEATAAESTASASPMPTASPEPVAWSEITAPGPAAREDHTWTLAPKARVAFLFGGRDGATAFDDLWAYDLDADAWTEVDARPGPAARFGHEAVWVDDVGLVVFAGQAGSTFFDDLWAFDPRANGWRQLPAEGGSPVARYGTCAAVGPDGRLWISHGFTSDGVRFSDTWAYDFATDAWTEVTPADGSRPIERCLHGCWWTEGGAFVLYAGQTTGVTAIGDRWRLEGGAWSELDASLPPDRNLYAHTPVPGGTVVMGGQAVDGSYLDDTWVLPDDGGDAVPVEAGAGPGARAGAEMVTDADGRRVLLFGGRNAEGSMADLWSLTGVSVGS